MNFGALQHRFWAAVCKTVRPMLSDRCLSCLSVMLVYCGQTVGWLKMKLGTEVGLGLGNIVLDGHSPQFSAHVCCGQTAGWIKMPLGTEVGLSVGDIIRWGPPLKGAQPPFFADVYCVQMAGWIKILLGTEVGLGPGDIVLHGYPAAPKRDTAPNFRPMSVVAKRLVGSRCHLVRR